MNPEEELPRPKFTGIFIPAAILAIEELSMLEMMLLSWVDALHCDKRGGCFAKNEYLASKLHVKENTIAKALTHLRELYLIEQVSFDGRIRVIKTKVDEYKIFMKSWSQSNAGLDLNPMLDWIKIQGSVGEKSNPENDNPLGNPKTHTYHERKEERKEENNNTNTQGAIAPSGCDYSSFKSGNSRKDKTNPRAIGTNPRSSPCRDMLRFGTHVRLRDDQYKALCAQFGEDTLIAIIEEMNDYCAASRPKGYADYPAAIRQWMRRRKNVSDSSQARYVKPPLDRRTRNADGTPDDAPHLKGLF